MNAGVLCDDRWHPAEVVEQGMGPLQSGDTVLEFLRDTKGWSLERMRQYDVLVVSKGNGRAEGEEQDWLTEEVQRNFRDFVAAGGGLLVCHSGTVGYPDELIFRSLVGGVFARHPHQCPVTLDYRGDFGLDEHDPATITVFDEHYFVEVADDINVFLTSTSTNGTQSAGWTRTEGKGRVCVLTPGHNLAVWLQPCISTRSARRSTGARRARGWPNYGDRGAALFRLIRRLFAALFPRRNALDLLGKAQSEQRERRARFHWEAGNAVAERQHLQALVESTEQHLAALRDQAEQNAVRDDSGEAIRLAREIAEYEQYVAIKRQKVEAANRLIEDAKKSLRATKNGSARPLPRSFRGMPGGGKAKFGRIWSAA